MHLMSKAPNIDISDDLREKALKRTAALLGELNKIRCTLELPVDQLPIVIETYGNAIAALVAEAEREDLAKRTKRVPLMMRSENRDYQPMKILQTQMATVIVRPQTLAFRPEDIAIHGDRSRWRIHDIKVGCRSQTVGSLHLPFPGTEFGPGGVCASLRLETLQTAMDFALLVEYVGPEADGEVFEATVVGTTVV